VGWGDEISNNSTLAEAGEHWLENYFQFLFQINPEKILIGFNIPGTGPMPDSISHYMTHPFVALFTNITIRRYTVRAAEFLIKASSKGCSI
jgi:hypothetical protein